MAVSQCHSLTVSLTHSQCHVMKLGSQISCISHFSSQTAGRRQQTGNRQQAGDSRELIADNRQQQKTADIRQQAADIRKQRVGRGNRQ